MRCSRSLAASLLLATACLNDRPVAPKDTGVLALRVAAPAQVKQTVEIRVWYYPVGDAKTGALGLYDLFDQVFNTSSGFTKITAAFSLDPCRSVNPPDAIGPYCFVNVEATLRSDATVVDQQTIYNLVLRPGVVTQTDTLNLLSGTSTLTVTEAGNGSGTVTSVPAGINCGNGCSASYPSGTSVVLTAAAASGSTFTGWSGGGCSGTGTCTVTMNAALTVTATFTLNAPTVTNVTSSASNGTYGTGALISLQVVFSQNVIVTGTPQLAVNSGATATYASGSGTNTLTFTYTVSAGESSADLDEVATTSLTLNGGTIKDAASNNATLTLPAPQAAGSLGANKAIVIDAVAPTVANVTSSTADGTYGTGAAISIQVVFSENVTVTGTPQLAVNSGATVSYASGTGSTSLTFTYTVAAGENSADLDEVAATSLTLNGGSIKDAAGNNATLTLPAPQAAGSLGANKAIVVSTLVSGWTTKASMPTARFALAAGVVNGVAYAVGGNNGVASATVEAYDPTTNTWTVKAAMPTARAYLAAGVVNGVLYAVGGTDGSHFLTTVEAYDPATNTWTTKAPMPTARYGLAVGVVNGVLYAVGGYDGSSGQFPLATVEAYDPATNTWTTKASMPTARWGLAVGIVSGVLYAVGGYDGTSFLTTVEAYDPATNTWTTKAPAPTVRFGLAAGVVNGLLYAVGGFDGTNYLTTVEGYDPATNTWTTKTSMPTERYLLAVGVVNGIVYAVGGDNSVSGVLPTVEAYVP